MPPKTPPSLVDVETPTSPTPSKKIFTNWAAFDKAHLVPTVLICDVIKMHPADEACKTRLIPTAKAMVSHYESGHGGGFQIRVKQSDGKTWPGWKELSELGMEATGLRCEVCDRQVQISPRDLLNHLRPHQGKFRGAFQNYRDTFFLQIQNTPPDSLEDDDESYTQDFE